MIRRLLCWLGWHLPPRNHEPELSIRWECRSCGQILPGELALKRRRP